MQIDRRPTSLPATASHRLSVCSLAPTCGSAPCTDPRQCPLHRPPAVPIAPTCGSAPRTDPRQCSLHRPPAVLLAQTRDSPPCTNPQYNATIRPIPRRGMSMHKNLRAGAVIVSIALGIFVVYATLGAQQGQSGPRYVYDPGWPKPLPNNWKMGGVTGLAVDPKDDTVWAYDRPNDLTNIELEKEIGIADCCTLPPSMIHFDKEGNVIGSFQAPQGHGMDVDSKGFAYLGQNTVRKYDVKTGKLVGAIEHTPDLENGNKFQEETSIPNHTPGVGGAGPVSGFLPPPPGAARGGGGRGGPRKDD